ncbi:MAG: hypothetical protein IH628_10010 [Proteobacteria bacterium]|nr:hypothetical protein [Pseudomonadota bacterium]
MENCTVFPDKQITDAGPVSKTFLDLGIENLQKACRYVHELPYGYNSNSDDLMTLFKEKMGTCTTKHAVIATLTQELALPIRKNVGIYAMTEDLVTGTDKLLAEFGLPYIPMLHCFLAYETFRVDLTEGNRNGKNHSIEKFLHVEQVEPNISTKNEYLLYRKALQEVILKRPELRGVDLKRILHAREAGLKLLKANLLGPA